MRWEASRLFVVRMLYGNGCHGRMGSSNWEEANRARHLTCLRSAYVLMVPAQQLYKPLPSPKLSISPSFCSFSPELLSGILMNCATMPAFPVPAATSVAPPRAPAPHVVVPARVGPMASPFWKAISFFLYVTILPVAIPVILLQWTWDQLAGRLSMPASLSVPVALRSIWG